MRAPRAEGAGASGVDPESRRRNPTADHPQPQLARLPRRLLRKIVVEPTVEGWQARIVGFDARFWNGATSRTFASRHLAMEAAKAASLETGLPVITVETLTPPDEPSAA